MIEPPQIEPGSAGDQPPADMAEVGNGTKSGVASVCPYLLVPGASWRAARPLREHRCMAVSPIDAPSLETQRSLCLAAFTTCPRFEAATVARRARWLGSADGLVAFEARVARRVPRVAPVALDRPSAIAGPLSLLGGSRRLARIALAVVMVGAAVLLLAARFAGGPPGDRLGASPEATTPAALASPTAALATLPASPSLPATSTPRPSPSAAPVKTPKPAATRRYKVKSGDTLSGIAARFGTTVAVIKRLNNISDASRLRTGQVLRLP